MKYRYVQKIARCAYSHKIEQQTIVDSNKYTMSVLLKTFYCARRITKRESSENRTTFLRNTDDEMRILLYNKFSECRRGTEIN